MGLYILRIPSTHLFHMLKICIRFIVIIFDNNSNNCNNKSNYSNNSNNSNNSQPSTNLGIKNQCISTYRTSRNCK